MAHALVCSLPFLVGCGAATYSYQSVRAARSLERARQLSAEERAPFEHKSAEIYLEKAREAASEAQYQDAIHYARWSERMALKAVELSVAGRSQEAR